MAITLGLAILRPTESECQDLTKILTAVENVSIFGRYGGFLPRSDVLAAKDDAQHGLRGYGVELSYDVPTDSEATVQYEVGLGYSQLSGFHSVQTDLDLRASVRELPSITFYAIKSFSRKGHVPDVYAGLVTGLVRLQNAVAYKSDGSELLVGSEAFTTGALVGLGFGSPLGSPFIELGYRSRRFPSLEYKETGGATKVPVTWPRDLNFSGWSIDVGIQMNIKGHGKKV
jgi:hypothetical protein